MARVPCPRACKGAPNCDECWGAGEVDESLDEPFESAPELQALDPTERMSREELEHLRASSMPPPRGFDVAVERALEDLASADLDDVPEDEPTRPQTPVAIRESKRP